MLSRFLTCAFVLLFSASNAYAQQSLQDYARECAKAVGGGVPAYSCKDGALIPITNYRSDSSCDNPAFLHVGNACIQHSRFGKLTPTNVQPGFNADDIEIRFLCRHYQLPNNTADYNERYDDIAVIQTNKKTGATCFYQSPTGAGQDMAGTNIPAPSDPNPRIFTSYGPNGCTNCHNARAFINTPFLQNVPNPHKIPHPKEFNRERYWFPGESGADAKIFSIKTADTRCTTCHNIASTSDNGPSGSSASLSEQSVGNEANPNTADRGTPYMHLFAGGNPADIMKSYQDCVSAGPNRRPANCQVTDITTAARKEYENNMGSTPTTPILGSVPVLDGKIYTLTGGFSGKCLDVAGGATNNGAKLQQWECNGSRAQKFQFKRVRDDLWSFASVNQGRCVSAEGASLADKTSMILWDCNNTGDQLVRIRPSTNGSFKLVFSHSSKCMDVQDTSADNGKAAFQYECVDAPDQNWFINQTEDNADAFDGNTFSMVGGFSGKCLDVVNGGTDNGAKLQQWDCNGSNAQKFRFKKVRDDLYTFSNVAANRCVSAEAANLADRTSMILWECKNSVDQLVRIQSGSNGSYKIIFSHSNKCMDVQDTSADNGKAIFQYQCLDVADQNWYLK
jgi:hypothetical protein